MTNARIAICIPAFNASRTLPRLFDSIRAQTSPFDEVLVYDDASKDDTADVATRLGARVVRGAQNVGCSAGKNALLAETSCEWVHFHDADDIVLPEFVERARRRIAAESFDVLLFDYEQVNEDTGELMSRAEFARTAVLATPMEFMVSHTVNNCGVYSAPMLRRLGGFDDDPAVRYNEDRAFHLRLASAGARFAHEPYVGSRFFFAEGSMSAANQVRCAVSSHVVTQRFHARHPDKALPEISRVSWANATTLASYLAWPEADACVELAVRAGGRIPSGDGAVFRFLCSIDARAALRIREYLIRAMKPHLRPRIRAAEPSRE
jgi:glycosyltransferase involved in cell wall biosynthesis